LSLIILGRMKNDWRPPDGHVFVSGRVGAIIERRKADRREEFVQYLKRDSWETVLPELLFRPEGETGTD